MHSHQANSPDKDNNTPDNSDLRQLSRNQLAVLIGALMSTAIGQSLVFAILAPLGREVALSEIQITSIIAISALVFSLASPFWGRLSDRAGRKTIMMTGLIGYTLGTLLFTSVFQAALAGYISGTLLYPILLLTRCLQGCIMSATGPAATAYAADNSTPGYRTRTLARLGTANSLGTILGPAVSGALAIFGLLAPLYFAAALTVIAAWVIWRLLPLTPKHYLTPRNTTSRLRVNDVRIRGYLFVATGLFIGFSAIQQTLGFHIQDKLGLNGIQTAQTTGAALMVSALFTFTMQMTAMQRLKLTPRQFLQLALASLAVGAYIIAIFEHFGLLAVGMAFIGTGLGLGAPAAAAGASLAVNAEEQGSIAGLISACPAFGFVIGPVCAGLLYRVDPLFASLFSVGVFVLVLMVLIAYRRQ
ncbi:MAG: MFS transporter [Parahaliea sp.]